MKITCSLAFFALFVLQVFAQAPFTFDKKEVEANLRFIASDQMAGRRTASPGEKMAADFIIKQLTAYGVKPVPGQQDYFQAIPFSNFKPPKLAQLTVGNSTFKKDDNLLIIKEKNIDAKTEIVFANHGWVDAEKGIDDYKNLDVKGKIVLTIVGTPAGNAPDIVFESMAQKQKLAAEHGAVALLEVYRMVLPWHIAQSYFGKEKLEIDSGEADGQIPYGWVKEETPGILTLVKGQDHPIAELKIEMGESKKLTAFNVVGVIEGSDVNLKNEYVLLSAHYDHMGVGRQGGAPFTPQDSIFNGARDNGMGVVAMLAAAKELAVNPPKRSVLVLACTGEEMGLLGSQWYAEHPLVPLKNMAFNLNTDGAGYNTTTDFNIIGLGFTNADEAIKKAGIQAGLNMLGDPAPEQGLYQRSDNFSFAKEGVPSVDMAPGIKAMDEEIFKYYHQAADNPDSIDYDYLLKFCKTFTLAARNIADLEGKIEWIGEAKSFEKN